MLALSLSGAAAAAASCDASTLSGYQHMQDLTGQGFILHWSLATPTRLDIAVEAKPGSGAENGWISVGWSADGKMAPADAVIGNLPGVAVGAYDISGYDGTTIVSSTSFKISGGLLSSANGRSTIIKFSRAQGDGGVSPLVLTGSATNTIIWGYSGSGSKALDYHGTFRGSAKISFNCGGTPTTPTTPTTPVPTPSPAPGSTGAGSTGGSTSNGTSNGTRSGSGSGSGSSSGAANLPACDASTLTGYAHSKDLTGKGFLLHWTLTPAGLLDMALEAKPASGANKGWISMGWSAAGKMYPADTVIGNLPDGSVGAYYMSGYDASAVLPSTNFKISKASTVAANGGSTIIKFSRSKGDGGISPLVLTGPATNTIIWGFSAASSKALDYHGTFRGSAKISFNCNSNGGAGAGAGAGAGNNGTSTGGSSSSSSSSSNSSSSSSSSNSSSSTGSSSSSSGGSSAASASSSSSGNSSSSSSNGKGSGCTPSTIAGLECSTKLSGDNFILHWKANATTISFACEVATAGWVSLGWSADGKMFPADAVVGTGSGNSASVAPHSISSYTSVSPSSGFAVSATAVESGANGKTVVKFTRQLAVGSFPINANGVTKVIWAYSADGSQSLANHMTNR
ncbi:unnamed protein product [Closterium sp. Naga37s-1]|nr:unnamed protein product [Closterium sp. Naga37s-1]